MEGVRTCIGCRSRSSRSSLLRVVVRGSEIVVDEAAVLPGRGAWLHPSIECYTKATQRRAFGRALRLDPAVNAALSTQTLQNRLNGNGQLMSGSK